MEGAGVGDGADAGAKEGGLAGCGDEVDATAGKPWEEGKDGASFSLGKLIVTSIGWTGVCSVPFSVLDHRMGSAYLLRTYMFLT